MFGIHNHQPVGNFEHVLDKAYEDSYKPLLDVLNQHPKIKFSLHCSGILWDYFKNKRNEYIDTVKQMVNRSQTELLSGGYYEPILPSIPDIDRAGQIAKMNNFIKSEFNYKPRGCWLAERVWDGYLAKVLSDARIEYTIIDDYHFNCAGVPQEDLTSGYYITEHEGYKLKIFPISQVLRYFIPFKNPEDVMGFLSSLLQKNDFIVLTMADDGEKFGLWPGTKKLIYEEKWLDRFLNMIEDNSDWVETITFSEFIDRFPPKGRIYLPSASYFEMTEWSLLTKSQIEFYDALRIIDENPDNEKIRKFVRGGIWQNFLVRYPESNNMQKKMSYISDKVHVYGVSADCDSGKYGHLLDLLWQGQCNCAYWHGVFGGLYLPHLRHAIYKKLIETEAELDKLTDKYIKQKKQISLIDFDCDGQKEVLVETEKQNIYFAPHNGGAIIEWDFKEKGINLGDVLTRREEPYHKKIKEFIINKLNNGNLNIDPSSVKSIHDMVKFKEGNLDKYLNYDWYRKVSLLDHFIHPDTTYENFSACKYGEQGDFVLGKYVYENHKGNIVLSREGNIWDSNVPKKVKIVKNVDISETYCGLRAGYKIINQGTDKINLMYGAEFNFSFTDFQEQYDVINRKTNKWFRPDKGAGISVELTGSTEFELWAFPIYTVSLSEDGFERIYQGTTVMPVWKFEINPDNYIITDIKININKL